MASIEDLERSLQVRLEPDTFAVYADALQSQGDPRGEVIALDLEIDAHAPSSITRRFPPQFQSNLIDSPN